MTACPTVSPHRPGWPATAAPVALAVFWLVRTEGVVSASTHPGQVSHEVCQHGHAPGCTRLAHDQEADAAARRARLPPLIERSEPARGPLQRHLLTGRITDDWPRCGWHGYLHDSLATIGGDWSAAVCDNCYADLHPAITVAFFSVRAPGDQDPFTVIRQRTCSDSPYPDAGQVVTWQLRWEHTALLVDDARSTATKDITLITRHRAEQITGRTARQYWPPDAVQLPWVASACPG